jgi:hypothetical protein
LVSEREAFIRDKYIQRRFAANYTTTQSSAPETQAPVEDTSSSHPPPLDTTSQIRMPKDKKKGKQKAAASASSTPDAGSVSTGLSMFEGMAVTPTESSTPPSEPAKKVTPQRRVGASPWVMKEEETKVSVEPQPPFSRPANLPPVAQASKPTPQVAAITQAPPMFSAVEQPSSTPFPQASVKPMVSKPIAAPEIDLLNFEVVNNDGADAVDLLDLDSARVSVDNARVSLPKSKSPDDPFADILSFSQPANPVPVLPGPAAVQPAVAPPLGFPFASAPHQVPLPMLGVQPVPTFIPAPQPFMQPTMPQGGMAFPFMQPNPAPAPSQASAFSFMQPSSVPANAPSNSSGQIPSGFSFMNSAPSAPAPAASSSAFGFM